MNKRGLTLVELVAVLVVLSIIALIVTPTINGSIKEYKEEMYNNQLSAIKNSAVNFSADHASEDYFPKDETEALKVTLKDLQDDGYIDENIKNPKDGGYFNPNEVFVLITCDVIEDETLEYNDNYKYTYEIYINNDNYIESKAIEKAKNEGITSTTTYDISSIGVYTSLKKISGTDEVISATSVEITVTQTKDGHSYSAKVNE